MGKVLTASIIFARTAELMRDGVVPILAFCLPLVALGTVADALLGGADAAGMAIVAESIIAIAAQYWLTRHALKAAGRPPAPGSLFGRFFILSLIVSIGVSIGLLLLVIPGVILSIRLAASVPALVEEDLTVRDAMDFSWQRTEDHFWPLLPVFGLLFLPSIILLWSVFFVGDEPFGVVPALLINIVVNAATIAVWYAATAVHLLTSRPGGRLAEVFA
ncbi:YciC family protein [Sphingosinicella sp. YJ22]|uniref:YciC family protein n=1 Tax=Sphingosinicella sp. YJ22 TaxID=1104780 RepID=UPI00140D7E0C|nr:YciC family protein [Sphingosinicella sp. YJ22]